MKDDYDVAIIGAGTAGLTARAEVAERTDDYVVIDGGKLGTTCARIGCMPSKSLIEIANAFHRQQFLQDSEIIMSGGMLLDGRNVMRRVRGLRDRFSGGVKKGMESWRDRLIRARARFIDPNTLDLEGRTIRADRIIIATGTEPVMPGEWEKYGKYLVDADRFFDLETLPEKMAVIGLGPMGVELGQALSRLGVDVIALNRNQAVGGLTDPKIQEEAIRTFSREMQIRIGKAEILGEAGERLIVGCKNESWNVDKVLVAMGRKPAVKSLGLENLGVALDDRGLPNFNAATLQIGNLPVFIAGDANGIRPLLHEASDEGRIAGYNATVDVSTCFQKRVYLSIIFSDPAIAVVGSSYASLLEDGVDFVIGESNYKGQGRALMAGRDRGMVRVYVRKEDGSLLGGELLAPDGEHLAHLVSWMIACKLCLEGILSMPFYHPTLEEGLRGAFREALKKSSIKKSHFEMPRCEETVP